MTCKKKIFNINLIDVLSIFFVLTLFAISLWKLCQSGVLSRWAYGDAQMLNAGINFLKEGFLENNFLPLINPGPEHDLIANNGPNGRYFHYPAFHAILVGLVYNITDSFRPIQYIPLDNLRILPQVVFLIISTTGLWLLYLINRMLAGGLVALISIVIYTLYGWYFDFGFSVCDQPISFLLTTLTIYYIFKHSSPNSFSSKWPLMCAVAFLSARNSIETPIILGVLIFVYELLSGMKGMTAQTYRFKNTICFLLFGAIALLLQILQSYLEFQNISEFLSHWGDTYSARFDLNEAASLKILMQLWLISKWIIIAFGIFFLLHLIIYFYDRVRPLGVTFGTLVAHNYVLIGLYFGTIAIFAILPRQMYYMHDYTVYYIILPVLMSLCFSVKFLHTRYYKFRAVLAIVVFIGGALFLYDFSKALPLGIHNLTSQRNIFYDDFNYWAYQQKHKTELQKLTPTYLESLRNATDGDAIYFVPKGLQGNSSFESNPIFEFYTQHHSVPDIDIPDKCKFLKQHFSRAKSFAIIDDDYSIAVWTRCD